MVGRIKWVWGLLCLSVVVPAWAADQNEGPFARAEYFTWEEFNDAGERLLRERGPRIAMGVEGDNFARELPGFVYRFSGAGYVGSVTYEGRTIKAPVAVTTSTDYLGLSLEALGGQRYGFLVEPHRFDLLFGGALDLWLRNLRDSHDANGNFTMGYRETYLAWTAKAALGLSHQAGNGVGYFMAGVKYPAYVSEWLTLYNVVLHPQGRPSWFARWTMTNVLPFQRTGLSISLFYDSWRFAVSDREADGDVRVWQPESSMDVIGVEIGLQ